MEEETESSTTTSPPTPPPPEDFTNITVTDLLSYYVVTMDATTLSDATGLSFALTLTGITVSHPDYNDAVQSFAMDVDTASTYPITF